MGDRRESMFAGASCWDAQQPVSNNHCITYNNAVAIANFVTKFGRCDSRMNSILRSVAASIELEPPIISNTGCFVFNLSLANYFRYTAPWLLNQPQQISSTTNSNIVPTDRIVFFIHVIHGSILTYYWNKLARMDEEISLYISFPRESQSNEPVVMESTLWHLEGCDTFNNKVRKWDVDWTSITRLQHLLKANHSNLSTGSFARNLSLLLVILPAFFIQRQLIVPMPASIMINYIFGAASHPFVIGPKTANAHDHHQSAQQQQQVIFDQLSTRLKQKDGSCLWLPQASIVQVSVLANDQSEAQSLLQLFPGIERTSLRPLFGTADGCSICITGLRWQQLSSAEPETICCVIEEVCYDHPDRSKRYLLVESHTLLRYLNGELVPHTATQSHTTAKKGSPNESSTIKQLTEEFSHPVAVCELYALSSDGSQPVITVNRAISSKAGTAMQQVSTDSAISLAPATTSPHAVCTPTRSQQQNQLCRLDGGVSAEDASSMTNPQPHPPRDPDHLMTVHSILTAAAVVEGVAPSPEESKAAEADSQLPLSDAEAAKLIVNIGVMDAKVESVAARLCSRTNKGARHDSIVPPLEDRSTSLSTATSKRRRRSAI